MRIKHIRLQGVAEEADRMKKLGTEVVTTIATDVIGGSANLLATEWRRVAPYDPRVKPKTRTLKSGERRSADYGHARDNIKVQAVRPQKRNAVVFRVTTGDAFWMWPYEYGKFDQPPRPVFRPATERLRGKIEAKQKSEFELRIAQAWTAGGKG